jgi:hypothetical protein
MLSDLSWVHRVFRGAREHKAPKEQCSSTRVVVAHVALRDIWDALMTRRYMKGAERVSCELSPCRGDVILLIAVVLGQEMQLITTGRQKV